MPCPEAAGQELGGGQVVVIVGEGGVGAGVLGFLGPQIGVGVGQAVLIGGLIGVGQQIAAVIIHVAFFGGTVAILGLQEGVCVGVAGDARRGQSLVVWAIAEGRGAAEAVNKYLDSM